MPRVKVPVPIEKQETAVALPDPVVESTVNQQPLQPLPEPSAAQGSPRYSSQQLMMAGFGVVLVVMLIFVVNLTHDRNQLKGEVTKLSSNPAATKDTEVKQLTNQIGQTFLLPSGETPTLATVTDIAKVQGQPFFKNAQNNDKVLLYSKAGEAILYRPSIKKVINIAPVDLSNTTSQSNSSSGGTTLPAPAQ